MSTGLWPWVKPGLRRLFSLRIYREVEADLRYRRRLHRDIRHRGRSAAAVERQWNSQVEPMHVRHVMPQRSSADLVLGRIVSPAQLSDLVKRIRHLRPRAHPARPKAAQKD